MRYSEQSSESSKFVYDKNANEIKFTEANLGKLAENNWSKKQGGKIVACTENQLF